MPKAVHAVHSLVREADLRDRLLPDGLPFSQAAIGHESCDPSGSVEERDASIMIFQHPDRRLGEVIAIPARRDLQGEAVISDRIVSPRDPLLVDAHNVLQIAHKGHESRSLIGCVHCETSVVLGQIDLGKLERNPIKLNPGGIPKSVRN